MSCEITVKMKDSEKSVTEKMRVYRDVLACVEDEDVDSLVEKVRKKFGDSTFAIKTTITIKILPE